MNGSLSPLSDYCVSEICILALFQDINGCLSVGDSLDLGGLLHFFGSWRASPLISSGDLASSVFYHDLYCGLPINFLLIPLKMLI